MIQTTAIIQPVNYMLPTRPHMDYDVLLVCRGIVIRTRLYFCFSNVAALRTVFLWTYLVYMCAFAACDKTCL